MAFLGKETLTACGPTAQSLTFPLTELIRGSPFFYIIVFFIFAWEVFLLFFGGDGMRGCVVLVEENVQGRCPKRC